MKSIEEYAIGLVADGAVFLANSDLNEDGELDAEDRQAASDLARDIAQAIRDDPDRLLALVGRRP